MMGKEQNSGYKLQLPKRDFPFPQNHKVSLFSFFSLLEVYLLLRTN